NRDTVLKLEEQNRDLEKQLKLLNKKLKVGSAWGLSRALISLSLSLCPLCSQEDTQEWRSFQADLQTAVVVANDIKCEAQQEVRALRRRLQEEEARSERGGIWGWGERFSSLLTVSLNPVLSLVRPQVRSRAPEGKFLPDTSAVREQP
uniref:Uncharacterized protein n=1 Tax=Callorhinchus milii TaxID=7868 RepID=A0A4W3IJJ4_CALMI